MTYYQLAGYKNKADYDGHQKDLTQDSKEDRQQRYTKFDLSIIKNIAGGKAYSRKNPYLLSESLLVHLTEQLGFNKKNVNYYGETLKIATYLKSYLRSFLLMFYMGMMTN
ncbi:hypothetical protein AAHB65_15395 [Bacillus toyonensis]